MHGKNCDYVLIVHMEKYEIAYYSDAEAKKQSARIKCKNNYSNRAFGQNNRLRSKQ